MEQVQNHLAGGVPKLIRPMFALMFAYLTAGADRPAAERTIAGAAAMELLHMGTLCHDDVMDEASTRRGRPSVNARWSNGTAIVGGDLLLARSACIVAELGREEASLMANTLRKLAEGQLQETLELYKTTRSQESYMQAIGGKTAALISASCEMGVKESGGDREETAAAAAFGFQFGLAFQINDDILDLRKSTTVLGKPAGHDLREGVYTLPCILELEANPSLARVLRRRTPRAHSKVTRLLSRSAALDEAIERADTMQMEAEGILQQHFGSGEHSNAIRMFARSLLGELTVGDSVAAEALHYSS